MNIYEVNTRNEALIAALLAIWEEAVKTTHLFLTPPELAAIKTEIPDALRGVAHLMVALDGANHPLGFMGIEGTVLEMLFVAPAAQGQGVGKALIQYGVERHALAELTVNEENPQAQGFYAHLGFAVYRRSDVDEQGRPYPLLYMKRTPII